MNNLIIKKSQIVEAQFQGTFTVGQRYQFTEVPNLSQNNIILYGIECFVDTQLITTPNGNAVIAAANAPRILATFRNINKEEFVYQMPIYSLIRSNNGGLAFNFYYDLV